MARREWIKGLPFPKSITDIKGVNDYLNLLYSALSRWHFTIPVPTGGAEVFIDLTDVPSSYSGESGKVVAVKGAEDGLEFVSTGGATPTGTGFLHVTSGTEDGAAKLVANVDVDAAAGIAESKLSLDYSTHSNANDPTSDQKNALAGTSGTPSATNKFVTDSDSRNSNARTPTAHGHAESDVTNLATDLGNKEATANKGAASGYCGLDASQKVAIANIPTGTSSSTVCIGNDSRLSDSRTPTAHATTHKSGQSDAIKLDEFAAPTNNTNLNVSASAHGLCPILPNTAAQFLDGTGNWTAPVGTSGGTKNIASGSAATISNTATKTSNSPNWTKLKEIKVNETWSGQIQVWFDLYSNDGTHTAYGRISVNGSAKSSDFSTLTTSPGDSEEYVLTGITNGDLIQIWAKTATSGVVGVHNMYLKYKWQITGLGGLTLGTPLDTTDATVISTTNQDP